MHLARTGHDVRLWARDAGLAATMAALRENPAYLPGLPFPPELMPTASLPDAITGAQIIVMAVPSHGLRAVARAAAPLMPAGATLVSAAKGLEEGTLLRMSEVLRAEVAGRRRDRRAVGPELRDRAGARAAHGDGGRGRLHDGGGDGAGALSIVRRFGLYGSADVVGVEIGGALKNIIAIAAGVVEGLGLGHNALAALITRGLAELSRLAVGLGAQRETLSGLAGLGDLVLTCTGDLSRNRQVGIALARGQSLQEILSRTKMVAEGVKTTEAALALGARHGIELPIAQEMSRGARRDARLRKMRFAT